MPKGKPKDGSKIVSSVSDAKKIIGHVIHGIADKEFLDIVYVGKTTNLYKRYESHAYYNGHNAAIIRGLKDK